MKKIAIIGSNGFVGKALVRTAKNFNFEVTCVTRENFSEHKNKSYDCVINSAMPSKRFWSLNNPIEDIKETVVKTADIFYNWHYDKFVQISSISAENQLDIPYGSHKRSAEIIVEKDKSALIVRLGALYGNGLTKSALFDLINKNHMVNHKHIYVDINSEYNYIDVDYAANHILSNLNHKGVLNVGARDSISLLDLSKGIWDNPSYEGRLEKLIFKKVDSTMPSAKNVLKYINLLRSKENT